MYPEDCPHDSLRQSSEDTSADPTHSPKGPSQEKLLKDYPIDSNDILGHLKDYIRGHSMTWNAILGKPHELEQLQNKRILKMFAAKHRGANQLCEINVFNQLFVLDLKNLAPPWELPRNPM